MSDPIIFVENEPIPSFIFNELGNLPNNKYPLRAEMVAMDQQAIRRGVRNNRVWTKCYANIFHDLTVIVDAKTVVELGTRRGISANGFIRALKHTGGHLFSFDPVDEIKYSIFCDGYESVFTFEEITGEEAYIKYKDKLSNIDILYIDTDPHSYEQTKTWLNKYWINNVSGIIMLDDCAPQHQQKEGQEDGYGVLRAVEEFVTDNTDRIAYALSICNGKDGICIIKLKE